MSLSQAQIIHYEKKLVEMKALAIFGVCLSTLSATLILISLPLMYEQVQEKQTVMLEELNYCRSKRETFKVEIMQTKVRLKLYYVKITV